MISKIKYVLFASALMAGTATSMAQATYTDKDGNEYQFKKHFYLDIQGGGQYTLGEAKFKDLLSPNIQGAIGCLLYTSPSPRDRQKSRMPSSA